jgi:hypothetical protein
VLPSNCRYVAVACLCANASPPFLVFGTAYTLGQKSYTFVYVGVVPVPLSGTVQSQATSENRRPDLDNDIATLRRPTRARKSPAKHGRGRGQLPLSVEPGTAGAKATIGEADDPGVGANAQAPWTTPPPTARMMAADTAAVEAGAAEAGASTATAKQRPQEAHGALGGPP